LILYLLGYTSCRFIFFFYHLFLLQICTSAFCGLLISVSPADEVELAEIRAEVGSEDKGVEEGGLEGRKVFGKGALAQSLVCSFEEVDENEEEEVDASIVSAYLPSMALLIRAGWSGRSRSAKDEGRK